MISGNAKDTAGKWAVATMPQWTAGQSVTSMWGGSAVSVISGTKHPKEADEFAGGISPTQAASTSVSTRSAGTHPTCKRDNPRT